MPTRCPACDAPLAGGDRSCGSCGYEFEPVDGETAVAEDEQKAAPRPEPLGGTENANVPGKTRPAGPQESDPTEPTDRALEPADPDSLPPGTLLWGRFRIEGEIDRGGMGVVYRARDRKLEDRPVAVKVLLAALAADSGVRARFRKEVLTARDLRHTGIVGVYDYDDRGGHVGFAMELLDGHTLADHLAGRVPGSPLADPPSLARLPAVAALARSLAEALDFVHDAGLIHRDVKPSNIMILGPPDDPAAWQVKLLDFGIVRVGDGSGNTGQVQPGTAEYMAPELLSGRGKPSRASDLFSLGKVLYRALTGELLEFLSEIDPPSALVEGLPDTLDPPLVSCFGHPARRPKTASALAAAISDAADVVRKREEAERRAAEEEARRKAEEEARQQAEEEARQKAEEEALRKADEEARRKAEEEARQQAEEEALRKAEDEALRKAEDEALRKAEDETQWKAEEEARQKADEETARRASARRKKRARLRRRENARRRRRLAFVGAVFGAVVSLLLAIRFLVPFVFPDHPLSRWLTGADERGPAVHPESDYGPNPAGIDWVRIEGGKFKIGSDDGGEDERNGPRITVPTFEMSRSEVTVAQYQRCVDVGEKEGGCSAPHWDDGSCWVYDENSWDMGVLPQSFRGPNQPIVCVAHDQAGTFARWAGSCKVGEDCPVRLPSESEWEFAARNGGQDRKYPWGNEDPSCERVVMMEGGDGCGEGRSWEVCQKKAGNTYMRDYDEGLCDMAGNVWEWVADCYASDYSRIPRDGTAWDPDDCERRGHRGGAWEFDNPLYLRASNRYHSDPSFCWRSLGFRLARNVP